MPTATEVLAEKLKAKRTEMHGLFSKKTPDGRLDWTAADRDRHTALNDEVNEDGKAYLEAKSLEDAERANKAALDELTAPRHPAGHGTGRTADRGVDLKGVYAGTDGSALAGHLRQGLGDLFTESKAFKGHVSKGGGRGFRENFELPDVDVKTLMTTAAGWAPFIQRQPGAIMSAQQLPRIIDLFPTGTTGQATIRYMRESTYTSGAAEVAEAAQFGESALVLSETDEAVRKIAVFLPTTDEQLADVAEARSYINSRLDLQMAQRLDSQLWNGNGTSPNLKGFLNFANILTQAKGADTIPDAFYKAMVKVQTTGFTNPTAIGLNPTDWQGVRLLKTADGLYIYGMPHEVGPMQMWGLPVITSTFIAQGTGGLGDFSGYSQLYYRQGIEFEVSNSHSDYFIKGQLAVRATIRAALVSYRGEAFCKVTGL